MSMLENLKKTEAEKNLGGGDYFKVKNGNNVIRVLTEGEFHESSYQGKPTYKFVMFVIDRADGKVKPYFAPYSVYKPIAQLETDPFFSFEGMPMPYDINIKVENAGMKEVEYNVQASPNRTELTGEEIAAAQAAGSVKDYLKKLTASKQETAEEDVPFPSEEPAKRTPADIVAEAAARVTGKPAPEFLK